MGLLVPFSGSQWRFGVSWRAPFTGPTELCQLCTCGSRWILRQKRSLLRPLPTRTRASRHCTVPTTYLAHIWEHPKKRKHITPVVVDGSTRKMKISFPNPNGREGFRKASKSSRNSRMPGISRCRWTNVFLSLRKTPEYTSATMAVCASKACWEIARTLCGDGLYKCMNGVYRLHCVKQVILNDVKL